MTYQITINPIFADHPYFVCRWKIDHMDPLMDSNALINSGEIKSTELNCHQTSIIAEEITNLCKNEVKQKRKALNLKFDLTTVKSGEQTISTMDFFKLYGLLSIKLNPLTIQMLTPTDNFSTLPIG